jgi:hypothetical protein
MYTTPEETTPTQGVLKEKRKLVFSQDPLTRARAYREALKSKQSALRFGVHSECTRRDIHQHSKSVPGGLGAPGSGSPC